MLCTGFSVAQSAHVVWYNTEQGLPQNSVKDIAKDKYGFLWLATENGLCRFDGSTLIDFDKITLKNKHLMSFHGNIAKDSIFIKSFYSEDHLLINNRVVSASYHKKHDQKRNERKIELLNSYYYLDLDFDEGVTVNLKNVNHLIKKDSISLQIAPNYPFKLIDSHHLKIRSRNLIVVNGCLIIIDFSEKKCWKITPHGLKEVKADQGIYDFDKIVFWHLLNNQCLIYQNEMLFEISLEDNQLKYSPIVALPDFEDLNIHAVYFDKNLKKVFLGSYTKGLGVLSLEHFKVAQATTKDLDNVYYAAVAIDSNLIMTPNGHVLSANGMVHDFQLTHFKDYLFKTYLLPGNDQSYWMKYRSELFQYRLSKNNKLSLSNKVDLKKNITALFDVKGGVAVALDDLITTSLQSKDFKYYLYLFDGYDFKTKKHRLKFNHAVQTVLKTNDTTYLVGCYEGLYRLNTKSLKRQLIAVSANLNIKNIKQTSTGTIWVMVKDKGLCLLKNNQLLLMPLDQENALKNPHTVLEDASNHLWISTNNGLFKVPESELLAYASNPKKKVYYYSYTKNNGFYTNEFNGGCSPCGVKLENGYFALPSIEGFVFFKPQEVPHLYPQNGIYVERVKIDDVASVYFNEAITLNNDFFRATIYPDVPYFADNKNLHVEAFFHGKSTNWEPVEINNGYNITQLNHGSYQLTFRVLVSPNAVFFYKTITIEVEPLFYQTWYFKILIALLLVASLFFMHLARTRYLININKKLEFLVDEKTQSLTESLARIEEVKNQLNKETRIQKKLLGTISHDIATPLKFITLIASKLNKLSDSEMAKKRDLLLSIQQSSSELYNFTSTLKSYTHLYDEHLEKPFEIVNLFEAVEEKINLFHEFAASKSIVFYNHIHNNTTIYTNPNIVKMAVHNIIDNALKYTKSGSVTITFETLPEKYALTISDTGQGMDDNLVDYYNTLQRSDDPDKLALQKFGIGLHMVIQLLPLINGKLYFLKNKPEGTSVILEILIPEKK